MKFIATYTYLTRDRFVSAERLDGPSGLFERIAAAKFRLEYGCDEPERWNGCKDPSDTTTDWRVYREMRDPSQEDDDAEQEPLDANEIPAFKSMVACAKAAHGARKAKRDAEYLATQEAKERELLKTLQEKYAEKDR